MARRRARDVAPATVVLGEADAPPVLKADKGLLGGSCNRTACQAPGATWVNAGNGAHYCRSCTMEINRWFQLDHSTILCSAVSMTKPRHCDDYIDDPTQPECLGRFLDYHRLPAAAKYPTGDEAFNARMDEHLGRPMWRDPVPALFADHAGRRVRVVMASRFGDVGITTSLDAEHGYDMRVAVEALSSFSEEVDRGC